MVAVRDVGAACIAAARFAAARIGTACIAAARLSAARLGEVGAARSRRLARRRAFPRLAAVAWPAVPGREQVLALSPGRRYPVGVARQIKPCDKIAPGRVLAADVLRPFPVRQPLFLTRVAVCPNELQTASEDGLGVVVQGCDMKAVIAVSYS